MTDVVVIGAGLAGLSAAIRLGEAGREVVLVSKGIGGLQLGQGTIDVIGYAPELVEYPLDQIDAIPQGSNHPYQHFRGSDVAKALSWLEDTVGRDRLCGDGVRNVRLPTAAGVFRPTAVAQPSMMAGRLAEDTRYLIVGLRRLKDFYPDLVAQNLQRYRDGAGKPVPARSLVVDLEVRLGEEDTSAVNFARALDNAQTREELADLIRPHLDEGETVGLPAVLGLGDPRAWEDFQRRLGHPVFEIPLPPPSVPGMRLNEALIRLAKQKCRVINGAPVIGYDADGKRIRSVTVASAGRPTVIAAKDFVLATGGFESGGLVMDSYEQVTEPVFNLPVQGASATPFVADYWDADQPAFQMGLAVDASMRPCAPGTEDPVFSNLFATGGLVAGATRWKEKSGDGIALATALRAAETILGGQR